MNSFLKNLLWMFAGEGVARITRLFTAVILSRYLTPVEFGIAALVLSIDELVRVLTRNGIGQKIIQCSERELDKVCQRSYQVNWYLHIVLFALQVAISKPLAIAFNYPELQALLTCLAFVYLIYPFAMVQVNLVQREQRMKATGTIFGAQVGIDNILTALLALTGVGIWAIVLPKLFVAPLWVFMYRKAHAWRSDRNAPKATMKTLSEYAFPVFLVELFKAIRMNVDRIIIGALLGVEALGIYYFAVNAGAGLSLALIKAFSTVVLPNLSNLGRVEKHPNWQLIYRHSLMKFGLIIVPIIIAQLVLAPFYVPIVFGTQWLVAIPVLMVLCAATIFHGFIEIGSQVLRAIPKTRKDILLNAVFTSASFTAIGVGYCFSNNVNEQLFYIVIAMLTTAVLFGLLHFMTVSKALNETMMNVIDTQGLNYPKRIFGDKPLKSITLHTIK